MLKSVFFTAFISLNEMFYKLRPVIQCETELEILNISIKLAIDTMLRQDISLIFSNRDDIWRVFSSNELSHTPSKFSKLHLYRKVITRRIQPTPRILKMAIYKGGNLVESSSCAEILKEHREQYIYIIWPKHTPNIARILEKKKYKCFEEQRFLSNFSFPYLPIAIATIERIFLDSRLNKIDSPSGLRCSIKRSECYDLVTIEVPGLVITRRTIINYERIRNYKFKNRRNFLLIVRDGGRYVAESCCQADTKQISRSLDFIVEFLEDLNLIFSRSISSRCKTTWMTHYIQSVLDYLFECNFLFSSDLEDCSGILQFLFPFKMTDVTQPQFEHGDLICGDISFSVAARCMSKVVNRRMFRAVATFIETFHMPLFVA